MGTFLNLIRYDSYKQIMFRGLASLSRTICFRTRENAYRQQTLPSHSKPMVLNEKRRERGLGQPLAQNACRLRRIQAEEILAKILRTIQVPIVDLSRQDLVIYKQQEHMTKLLRTWFSHEKLGKYFQFDDANQLTRVVGKGKTKLLYVLGPAKFCPQVQLQLMLKKEMRCLESILVTLG